MTDLVWHRNNLRTCDNPALAAADDPLPVYVFDTSIMEHASKRRMEWVRENVEALRSSYEEREAPFVIQTGRAPSTIEELVEEFDVDTVHWHESYSPLGRRRDELVKEALSCPVETYHGEMMFPPSSITTNAGDPYSVFTYYNKKWQRRDKEAVADVPTSFADGPVDEVPSLSTLGFEEPSIELPTPGEEAAQERLAQFLENRVAAYDEQRDNPAVDGTSKLSFYRSYGVIGIRDIWHQTAAHVDGDDIPEGLETFREELAWSDFYTQVLYHNPSVVTENYKDYENPIKWRNDAQELAAWKDGKTGYPIVDAGMRQLEREGWMHNRVRMIVASFLTKDLLIDWREGYDWFRTKLLDHNTANDNGGWQWAASTGTDAQPYFRIFNPMSQGERYDPHADYISEYVPELRDVPPSKIHSWNELSADERNRLAPEYPEPIVDHSERREQALAMYKEARGDEEDD